MEENRYKNWTVKQWEQEFHSEDVKINAYINELSDCIDLPNENEIIYENLHKQNMLLPEALDYEFDDDDHHDELFSIEDIDSECDFELYYEIGKLAESFINITTIHGVRLCDEVLETIHIMGNFVSGHLDFMNVDEMELPALRSALLKKSHFMINKLIKNIDTIKSSAERPICEFDNLINKILVLREKIVDIQLGTSKNIPF